MAEEGWGCCPLFPRVLIDNRGLVSLLMLFLGSNQVESQEVVERSSGRQKRGL